MNKGMMTSTFLAIGIITSAPAWAGKLGETADRVESDDGNDNSDDGDDGDDYESDDGDCFLLCLIVDSLFDGSDDWDVSDGSNYSRKRALLPYPYAYGLGGYKLVEKRQYDPDTKKLISTTNDPVGSDMELGKSIGGQLRADYQYDWDNVHLTSIEARFEGRSGFGLAGRWTGFFEPLSNGLDSLHIAEAELFFDFLPASRAKLELAAVFMGMFYGRDQYAGGGGRFGLDLFPIRPLVISARTTVGGFRQTLYVRSRMTVGIAIKHLELFAGYDVQRFGTNDPIVYHGPLVGARAWF